MQMNRIIKNKTEKRADKFAENDAFRFVLSLSNAVNFV